MLTWGAQAETVPSWLHLCHGSFAKISPIHTESLLLAFTSSQSYKIHYYHPVIEESKGKSSEKGKGTVNRLYSGI